MKTIFRSCVLVLTTWITAATFAGTPDSQIGASRVDREYCYELLRYLYRWYLDDGLFIENPEIRQTTEFGFWIRELNPESDEEDNSLYLEVLLPIIETEIVLKKADYRIPESGTHIRNHNLCSDLSCQGIYPGTTVDKVVDHLGGYFLRILGDTFSRHAMIADHDHDFLAFHRRRN